MNLKKNPELIPLIEWWEKDGKSTLTTVLVIAIAVAGWYGIKNYRASAKAAASNALVGAYTTEELEEAVTKYGGKDVGPALKMRLAKSYFDASRFEESLALYDALAQKPAEGFQDVPAVGRAQCLEALGRLDEALKAFEGYAAANTNTYLTLTARLGAARVKCQKGDKAGALKDLNALKDAQPKDEAMAKARIETTIELVKRWEKKAPAPVAAPAPKAAPAAKPAPAKTAAPQKK